MQISKNFSLAELVASTTAYNYKIDNTPTPEIINNLVKLVENTLQPIRYLWGNPVFVSSGYRNPKLNGLVGGAQNSQHITGQAADISVGTSLNNKKLFDMIVNSNIPYDQLIDESNYQWIHVSYNANGNRKQILHL